MNNEETRLIEIYRGLSKLGQEVILGQADLALIEAQAVKRQYGLDAEPPKPVGAA
jgi:hypothetical protein